MVSIIGLGEVKELAWQPNGVVALENLNHVALPYAVTNASFLPSHGRFRGVRSLCVDMLYFELY
jgi:hypothetical protein